MSHEENFFLRQWCEQTTVTLTQVSNDVSDIKVQQEQQNGRIKALEKTEKTARWAIGSTALAVLTMIGEYFVNHFGRG